MSNGDKYPESSGRRRFVKGVVGSAALAGVGATGAAAVDTVTNPSGQGGGTTQYFGIENIDGPAPRAMPQIPVEVDSEGYIKGVYPKVQEIERAGQTVKVARMELGGTEYSVDWYQYCGVQGYEGLDPEYEGDNYFRYTADSSPNAYDWHSGMGGNRIHIDDFSDYETWNNGIGTAGLGKPASGTWRSQDTKDTIPIQVIRSARINELAQTAEGDQANWIKASTSEGFVGYLNKCTHFCCVPGFKTSTYENADNMVYCPCHQSIYDPFKIVKRSFVAFPRPEEN